MDIREFRHQLSLSILIQRFTPSSQLLVEQQELSALKFVSLMIIQSLRPVKHLKQHQFSM